MKTLTITLGGGPYLIRREGVTPKEALQLVKKYALLIQAGEDAANAPAVRRLAMLKAEMLRLRTGAEAEGTGQSAGSAGPDLPDVHIADEPADTPVASAPKARLLTDHRPNGDICGWWKVDGEDRYCPRRHRTPGAMHKWTMPPPPV